MARKPTGAGAAPLALTRGELIDQLELNRRERRKLEVLMKPLEDEYKVIKGKILESLLADKEEKAGTTMATVSVSHVTVPVIDDIEEIIKYLVKSKGLYALQGQPFRTPEWRELVERKGTDLPGTHTFEKVDLNHTSIKN
jgi:hypothetical protein